MFCKYPNDDSALHVHRLVFKWFCGCGGSRRSYRGSTGSALFLSFHAALGQRKLSRRWRRKTRNALFSAFLRGRSLMLQMFIEINFAASPCNETKWRKAETNCVFHDRLFSCIPVEKLSSDAFIFSPHSPWFFCWFYFCFASWFFCYSCFFCGFF